MNLNLKPIFGKEMKRPFLIAGPCSAETEEQVMLTAHELAKQNIDLYRAGIWKPRTRPNCFEGVGTVGLSWLKRVKQETGLKVTTEVANREHVFEALKYGIDVLWIGARTTVSPFAIQEIADALQGTNIPVFIKNPVNPDLALWLGAVERLHKAGLTQLAVIHRGFTTFGKSDYRNEPKWQLPIELKRQFPKLPVICDNSHICGRRDTLAMVAQKAMDLNYDGLMTEVHPTPDVALSDAAQQITPATYKTLVDNLVLRSISSKDSTFIESMEELRAQINVIDTDLMDMISKRMEIVEKIGDYKKRNSISILQPARWEEILKTAQAKADKLGISNTFVEKYLKAIHEESINHQMKVMNQKEV